MGRVQREWRIYIENGVYIIETSSRRGVEVKGGVLCGVESEGGLSIYLQLGALSG